MSSDGGVVTPPEKNTTGEGAVVHSGPPPVANRPMRTLRKKEASGCCFGCFGGAKETTSSDCPWSTVVSPLDAPLPSTSQPPGSGSIPLIVYLSGAENVPIMDIVMQDKGSNGADPYVVINCVDAEGKSVDKGHVWPTRNQLRFPIWNSARDLGQSVEVKDGKFVSGTKITLTLWDYDLASANDLIGKVTIDVSELPFNKPKGIALNDETGKACPTKLYICAVLPPPEKKTCYFVRHGESTWNEAQDDLMGKGDKGADRNKLQDLSQMAESRDNPLSEKGIQQALALGAKVSALAAGTRAGSDGEMGFLEAKAVWMSPLTRAMQTGLIGASSVCEAVKKINLVPNAREKRNLGGLDSSGSEIGEGILHRVYEETGKHMPDRVEQLVSMEFNLSEVQYKWWNENQESKDAVQQRMEDFMCQVRYCSEDSIIVVGHSHYFRELFEEYLHPDFHASNQTMVDVLKPNGEKIDESPMKLPEGLSKYKLMNAGVAKVEVDFSQEKIFTSAELLFDTVLNK